MLSRDGSAGSRAVPLKQQPEETDDTLIGEAWLDDEAACANISEHAYCDWIGIDCCCVQEISSEDKCEWCQAVNGSMKGSVAMLSLRGLGLQVSPPPLLPRCRCPHAPPPHTHTPCAQRATSATLPPAWPHRAPTTIGAHPGPDAPPLQGDTARVFRILEELGAYGLHDVNLSGNNLSGPIPAKLYISFPQLTQLNVSGGPGALSPLTASCESRSQHRPSAGAMPAQCAP
jgi:hypothetical protein